MPLSDFDIVEIKDAVTGVSKSQDTAVETAKEIIGNISDVIGFAIPGVGSIKDILLNNIFNIGGKNDKMSQQLQDIEDKLEKINSTLGKLEISITAEHFIQNWRFISSCMSPALDSKIFFDKPEDVSDPFTNIIKPCIGSLNKFCDNDPTMDKSLWTAVFIEQRYYQDKWSWDIDYRPENDGLTVFSYTYVLPAFLKVIYIYLSARAIFKWEGKAGDKPILDSVIQKLQYVHDKILNNIVPIKKPNDDFDPSPGGFSNDFYGLTKEGHYTSRDNLLIGGWGYNTKEFQLYGAVEKYSGYNSVDSYPGLPIPQYGPPHPSALWIMGVKKKLNLRIRNKMKKVYSQVGLYNIRHVINTLRSINGDEPLTRMSYGDWSLKEAYTVLEYKDQYYIDRWKDAAPAPFDHPSDENYPLRIVGIRSLANFLSIHAAPKEKLSLSFRDMLYSEPKN